MLTETLRSEPLPIVVPSPGLASETALESASAQRLDAGYSVKRFTVRHQRSLAIPLLILLTLIGGGLRFLSLDKPTIWGDEAATYGRAAGTYEDLLDQLWDSSFPPLHYEALWWIGQGLPYWGHTVPRADQPADAKKPASTFESTRFLVPGGIRLTPFFMRLIPAIAGSLFIPALYFLTRQLFGPQVSLLAACLACFSAYLLVYSRDGKMYMPFWTLCVINVGCLLWWMRVRRPLPWLAWLVSGTAMIGWHASGFMALGIESFFFFTSSKLHWRKLTTVAGYIAWSIAIGPLYVMERLRRRLQWRDRLRWPALLGWPRRSWATFAMPAILPFAAGLTIILSTMFGPFGFYSSFDSVYQRVSGDNRPAVDVSSLGIDWVGRYNAGRELSGYLLYTGSAYLTGWEWPRHAPGMGLDDQRFVYPRTLRLLQIATTTLMLLLTVGVVPWRKAFSLSRARLDRMRQDRLVDTAFRRRRVLWLGLWLSAIPWVIYTQSIQRPDNILDGFAAVVLKVPPSRALAARQGHFSSRLTFSTARRLRSGRRHVRTLASVGVRREERHRQSVGRHSKFLGRDQKSLAPGVEDVHRCISDRQLQRAWHHGRFIADRLRPDPVALEMADDRPWRDRVGRGNRRADSHRYAARAAPAVAR